ncbi:MAG: hypothetical protein M3M97_04175 [Actinomycetota bacterium]|nr:hypothetical protein [Actinomycetota bacterium]
MVLEEAGDLGRDNSGKVERGKSLFTKVFTKDPDPGGVHPRLRLFVQVDLANEVQLVEVVGDGRVPVLIPVVRGGELYSPHAVPGLLTYLSSCGLGGRLTDVGPAAKERPEAILLLFLSRISPSRNTVTRTSTFGVTDQLHGRRGSERQLST